MLHFYITKGEKVADIKSGFYAINSLSDLNSAYCIIQEDTVLKDISKLL